MVVRKQDRIFFIKLNYQYRKKRKKEKEKHTHTQRRRSCYRHKFIYVINQQKKISDKPIEGKLIRTIEI